MRDKIKKILSNSYTKQGEFDEDKALNELCVLLGVSKPFKCCKETDKCIIAQCDDCKMVYNCF